MPELEPRRGKKPISKLISSYIYMKLDSGMSVVCYMPLIIHNNKLVFLKPIITRIVCCLTQLQATLSSLEVVCNPGPAMRLFEPTHPAFLPLLTGGFPMLEVFSVANNHTAPTSPYKYNQTASTLNEDVKIVRCSDSVFQEYSGKLDHRVHRAEFIIAHQELVL